MSSESEGFETPKSSLIGWIGAAIFAVLTIGGILFAIFHDSGDGDGNPRTSSSVTHASQEFQYLRNIWAKPPNPVGGTWKINVTYHDDSLLVFNHAQNTETYNGVQAGSFRINLGSNSSGTVGYTINLNSRDGTWSQKYIEEGGTLRVTDITDDKIFVDQIWKGQTLNKFVLTKL